MEIEFQAIAEDEPGPKWQAAFEALWPAYKAWYHGEGVLGRPTWLECVRALRHHMPELMPLYERLCQLAGGSDLAARFLSSYRPPAYIAGCSQAVWSEGEPLLVRNYDYSPALTEGVILKSRWLGRPVIAMLDCAWGCLDGINDAGLAASLTFGGRRVVGDGFGIPLVVRYLLQTCETAHEAEAVLRRVPTHMTYNVTVCDRVGRYFTAWLAPDRPAVIRPLAIATNHQEEVEWHRHARATATVERERFLHFRLGEEGMTGQRLADVFLRSPLYNRAYQRGFGTLYSAVYRPQRREVVYRWPGFDWKLSFEDFKEGAHRMVYGQHGTRIDPPRV